MDAGTYLKSLRKKHRMSLDEVVELSGNQIDKTTLSRVERNERGVSLKNAYLLSKIYKVDFKTLSEKILRLQGVKSVKR
ncbi:MAG: helix-turn-helix transcriptional regulator [bacterium]